MADTTTTNYGLVKPGVDSFYDIDTFNNNADKIDTQMKQNATDVAGKVEKVTGKGLSTNDYTTAEKNKVSNLPADTNTELSNKASKGSSLSDYGISDAYTKAQTDSLIVGFKNITSTVINIPVSSWDTTALSVTVACAGMTADTTASSAIVSYDPDTKDIFTAAGIYGSAQGDDTITFKCTTIPTAAVAVNVMVVK